MNLGRQLVQGESYTAPAYVSLSAHLRQMTLTYYYLEPVALLCEHYPPKPLQSPVREGSAFLLSPELSKVLFISHSYCHMRSLALSLLTNRL